MSKIALFNFSNIEIAGFKKLSIGAVVLFGSQAQGLAGSKSDFDIGIILNDKKFLYDEQKRKKIYDFLYDLFSEKISRLTDIDLVFLETAPAELQAHVMKYGRVIFENSPNVFADYRAKVMEQCADFAPLRRIFHYGVMSKIR